MTESETVSRSTVAVHRDAWERVCPELQADLAAMVAPPVTVSSLPVLPVPGGEHTRAAGKRRNMATPRRYERSQ